MRKNPTRKANVPTPCPQTPSLAELHSLRDFTRGG